MPGLSELPRFRQNLEDSYLEYIRRCEPVAQALSGARRVGSGRPSTPGRPKSKTKTTLSA